MLLALALVTTVVLILVLGIGGCSGSAAAPPVRRAAIVAVEAQPWNERLSPHARNAIVADSGLGFAVTVENLGTSRERNVAVTLRIDRLARTQTIERLDAGRTATLTFRHVPAAQPSRLTTAIVETEPEGGTRTVAAFPVVFELYRPPARGGLHGTGLISVKALPGRRALSPLRVNAIVARGHVGFAVAVRDTGDSQETGVRVVVTILQTPSPIVATRTIPVIAPGQLKTVEFANLGPVAYAQRSTVQVDVKPVRGEKNLANNSARYPVTFSLG